MGLKVVAANMNLITRGEARLQGLVHYFTGIPCLRGHVSIRTVSSGTCLACDKEKQRINLRDPRYIEKNRRRANDWYLLNTERAIAAVAQYQKDNRHKDRAWQSKRRATRYQATPAWADLQAIEAVYKKAEVMTEQTGIPHHVDHIVPLQSKFVCGLHVPANLQIMEASANNSKGNRWWPDMPGASK